jgi:hypothetical protein
MLVSLTAQIPWEAIFRIERLADQKRVSRSAMARELLMAGLRDTKKSGASWPRRFYPWFGMLTDNSMSGKAAPNASSTAM